MDPIMPEAAIFLGGVPLAKYATPSTMEVPDSIQEYLQDYDAVLLENHGAPDVSGGNAGRTEDHSAGEGGGTL